MKLFKLLHEYFTLKEYRAYVYREQMLTEQWDAAYSFGDDEEKQRLQVLIGLNHEAYHSRHNLKHDWNRSKRASRLRV